MNVPVLNVWDETQQKYVGIPAVAGGGSVPKPLTQEWLPQGYPYGEKKTIYWDGVDDSLGTAGEEDNMYYRISEEVPTDDEFGGGTVDIAIPDGAVSYELASGPVYKDESASVFLIAGQIPVYIVRAPFVEPDGPEFEKTGVYVPSVGAGLILTYGIKTMDYRFLPNGYTKREEAFISWDGNTDGLTAAGPFYKVSDSILTNTEIREGFLQTSDGETVPVAMFWLWMEAEGLVTPEYVAFDACAFVRKAGIEVFGYTFPEIGVYFPAEGDSYTKALEYKKIIPMSEDFLPESAKGGGGDRFVVKPSAQDETGKITAVDKTFAEISAAIESGQTVVLEAEDEGITIYNNLTVYLPSQAVVFGSVSLVAGVGKAGIESVQITVDNAVEHASGSVTLDT